MLKYISTPVDLQVMSSYTPWSMARDAETTRERILDSAEALFAKRGFDGVTVRQIMSKAGADVALAYYHFKSKRDLFNAALLRRAKTLNELRLAALLEVEERHKEDEVSVEEIIDAFTRPLLDILENDPDEWRDYMALIAQINNSSEWGGELMTRFFDPLVKRFLDAIRRALPGCREEDLFWSYHFLSGALTLTFAETGRLDNLSDGLCRSSDMAAANARMARFIAAGFRELCDPDTKKPTK